MLQRSSRNVKAAAIIAGAVSLAASQYAGATIRNWNGSNSGNWSLAGNWTNGVPVAGDGLAFAGASYTSTHDVAVTHGSATEGITFNNTGAVTLNGTQWTLFSGARGLNTGVAGGETVKFLGAGAVNWTAGGATDGSTNAGATAGASLLVDNAAGLLTMSGGDFNLYALRVNKGGAVISGGTHNWNSADRGNDILAGNVASVPGNWGLSIGREAGQVGTLRITGGGTYNFLQGFAGDNKALEASNAVAGSITVDGGASALFPTTGGFGRMGVNWGTGTINVGGAGGAGTLTCRLFEGGRQEGSKSIMNIGAGGSVQTAQLVLIRSDNLGGGATLNVSTGGTLLLNTGTAGGDTMFIGAGNLNNNSAENAHFNVNGGYVEAIGNYQITKGFGTISAGGDMTTAANFVSSDGDAVLGINVSSTLVTGAGSTMTTGQQTIATGSAANAGGQGTVAFASGGTGTSTTLFIGDDGALSNGTLIVDGAGSTYTDLTQLTLSASGTLGGASVIVRNGGVFDEQGTTFMSGELGTNGGERSNLTLDGGTGTFASQFTMSAAGALNVVEFGDSSLTVSNSGQATINGNFFTAADANADVVINVNTGGTLTVNGDVAGAFAQLSTEGQDALTNPAPAGRTTMNIASGGVVVLAANTFTSDSALGGSVTINVGTASTLSNGLLPDGSGNFSQFQFGGAGGIAGSPTAVNVNDDGLLRMDDALGVVYSGSTLSIGNAPGSFGGAAVFSGSALAVDGRVNLRSGFLFAADMDVADTGRVVASQQNTPGNNANIDALIFVGTLTTNTSGLVDLNDNDMIVAIQPQSETVAQLVAGRGPGDWSGTTGITSTAANLRPNGNTTLGIMSGAEYLSLGNTTFEGVTIDGTESSLIKYTYYGDTDFNGVVDFDDYVRIDGGFNSGLSGWLNGDFDYNGFVDFDDYVLIDNAFNTQSEALAAANVLERFLANDASLSMTVAELELLGKSGVSTQMIEMHLKAFGKDYANSFLSSVPEPTSMGLIGLVGAGMLGRRRRSR